VDELRLFYLTHPDLDATEVLTTPTSSAVVAARRGAPAPVDAAAARGT
jgi:hypothetical protein